MLKAFIMIKLRSKGIKQAIEAIRSIDGVKRLYTMTGDYDVIVDFEGDETSQLHDFHFSLDAIDSIEAVVTNVVMKEFEP